MVKHFGCGFQSTVVQNGLFLNLSMHPNYLTLEKVLVISGQAKNTLAVFFDAIYTSLYKILRLMKKLTKVNFESKYTYILECLYAIKIFICIKKKE